MPVVRLSNYMLVGGVAHQQQAAQSDVEVYGDRQSNVDADVPAPIQSLVQRARMAHTADELDDAKEDEFINVLRGMGEVEVEYLKYVYHNTAKIAPRLSKTAKQLAGRA